MWQIYDYINCARDFVRLEIIVALSDNAEHALYPVRSHDASFDQLFSEQDLHSATRKMNIYL